MVRRNFRNRGRGRMMRSFNRRVTNLERSVRFEYPRGREDPPHVHETPIWSLILTDRFVPNAGGTTTFQMSDAVKLVQTQLGLVCGSTAFTNFQLRFKRVDAWYIGPNLHPLALRLCDLLSGSYACWVEDRGTPARNSHVHAIWPVSQQQTWYSSTTTKNLFQIDHFANTDLTTHIHVDIMFASGDPVPVKSVMAYAHFVPHSDTRGRSSVARATDSLDVIQSSFSNLSLSRRSSV